MNELPILFETHDLTQENLELLQIYEDIEFACIYDDQQELFSIYHRADEPLYLKITTQNYNKFIHASEGVEHVDYFLPPNAINIIEETYDNKLRISYLITFKQKIFGTISQMRRTIVSVPSNIVEGCAPESQAEYIRFLDIASYAYSLNTYSLKPYTLTT
jgi:hypothetical protein